FQLAINDLRAAVRTYPAESHQQACARWLLGAVQCWGRGQGVDAVANWEKGIEGFTRLARTADQANQATRKRWYRDRIVYMKGALQANLKERRAGERRESTPPDTKDARADAPHSPQSPGTAPASGQDGEELFQNLLSKVGGERLTAERLIEYERRHAPNASREELIRRAIERWEDDNR
ncbi:MAG: hypothetical protein M3Y68_02680, partial [Chloroflexota bacterium]|nr:hypothetical protein [Chloroflexota bacterium]